MTWPEGHEAEFAWAQANLDQVEAKMQELVAKNTKTKREAAHLAFWMGLKFMQELVRTLPIQCPACEAEFLFTEIEPHWDELGDP